MFRLIVFVALVVLPFAACSQSALSYQEYNAAQFTIEVPKGWETILDLNEAKSEFGQLRLKHDSKRMIDVSWGPTLRTFEDEVADARKKNESAPFLRLELHTKNSTKSDTTNTTTDALVTTEKIKKRTTFYSARAEVFCRANKVNIDVHSGAYNQKHAEALLDHVVGSIVCNPPNAAP